MIDSGERQFGSCYLNLIRFNQEILGLKILHFIINDSALLRCTLTIKNLVPIKKPFLLEIHIITHVFGNSIFRGKFHTYERTAQKISKNLPSVQVNCVSTITSTFKIERKTLSNTTHLPKRFTRCKDNRSDIERSFTNKVVHVDISYQLKSRGTINPRSQSDCLPYI